MWILPVLVFAIFGGCYVTSYEMIGYFWHITDFHYDAHFTAHGDVRKGCWKPEGPRASHRRPLSRYGDYSCDAPWDLIESATRAMMSRQGDNVEFVLWTGDSLSLKKAIPETKQLHFLQNLTDLLLKTFNSQFVFPALGHDDPTSRLDLGKMWSRWLPPDTIETLETGGYYMIEKTDFKRHVIVLNTNLMTDKGNNEEAEKQWEWLTTKLEKVYLKKETVYIVGHIPPGVDERQKGATHGDSSHLMYTDYHNRKYLRLVKKYSSIIHGQFFGHLHSDSFRVIYNEMGNPVSWVMLAPAMTPRRTTDGANNPGLRLYKFKKDTGQILDYTQYYLDLSASNSKVEAEWTVEYNFSSYYGISNITPLTLHTLAERLTLPASPHDHAFAKYYRANSVKMYKDLMSCDASCAHTHYCAITRVDYEEHEHCLKTAASALASSSGSQSKVSTISSIMLLMMLIVQCLV